LQGFRGEQKKVAKPERVPAREEPL
jgi:hypothetical protein